MKIVLKILSLASLCLFLWDPALKALFSSVKPRRSLYRTLTVLVVRISEVWPFFVKLQWVLLVHFRTLTHLKIQIDKSYLPSTRCQNQLTLKQLKVTRQLSDMVGNSPAFIKPLNAIQLAQVSSDNSSKQSQTI